MAINSIESAVKYSEELDKLFSQKSATGFFADNDFGKKFVGAKTVIVPDIDFQGLADYDRDTGFSRGAITVSNTSYTMQMDRARSLQIDREDMDETGIASLAGKILGEYVRTKVVPECDAYVLSKLATIAVSRGNTVDIDKPYETLIQLIGNVRNAVGYDEELVAFVHSNAYAALQNSSEISKMIIPSDFKQGEINLTVKSLNGVALIPVVGERMKTEFNFNNTAAGGFTETEESNGIYMLVCPKRAAHLVKKTENIRVFTPEQNIDADAYKFDYRIYYDAFVKASELDSVWCSVSADFEVNVNANDSAGAPGREIYYEAMFDGDAPKNVTYQWYYGTQEGFKYAKKLKNEVKNQLFIAFEEIGTHYIYCAVTVDGIKTKVYEYTPVVIG